MDGWTGPALALLIGYGLGSIPFGLILTKAFGAGDIRDIGSGSIGATNVLRTGRKDLAALTVLLDAGKGAVAVLIMRSIEPGLEALAGVAALVGHCYPVWLRFKGGKAVATAFGVILTLAWQVAAICAAVWLATVLATRISSIGGLSAALAAPVSTLLIGPIALLPAFAGMAVLIFWKHRENIRRLVAGTEPKVGQKTA